MFSGLCRFYPYCIGLGACYICSPLIFSNIAGDADDQEAESETAPFSDF